MQDWYLMPSFGAVALSSVIIVQPTWAQEITVTNVQIQRTDSGIELSLETPTGKQPETFRTTYGETLIIDLINTQLQGGEFIEENPAPGIALVEVVQQYANTVRVKLVGTEQVPNVEVTGTGQGIALNVTTEEMTTAQEPAPEEPSAEPEVTEEPGEETEFIELVVTATRTEERQEDVARSVTVIDREEIQQQATLTENLGDILGKLVPGFGPPNFANRTNAQTLRGRQPQILVDGVPLRSNSSFNVQLRYIAPSSIEQIEVVRGPTAIYGGEATGGVINIITREPTEQQFEATSEVGIGAALGGLEGDSFRNRQQQTLSFNQGDFDFTFTFSRNDTGGFFDAEGDRIAPSNAGLNNTETLNFNGKLGIDLSEEQRLQLTANYTRDRREVDFLAQPNPEDPEEKAIAVERDLTFEGDTEPKIFNTVANLSYTHDNLLGSEVQAQAFYRNSLQRSRPFDFGSSFANLSNEEETWGARAQANTQLGRDVDLLWGVDFERQEEAGGFNFNILSGSDFEQGVVRQVDEQQPLFPPFELNQLGLFAQLQWDVSDWLALSGGIRNERFGFQADDFMTASGDQVQGGERDFSDTVFNVGAVAKLNEQINVFAKFSQGFSAPPFGDALSSLPQGVSVEAGFPELQPEVVDEYEIGIRGNWDSLQASLSGFYNFSELGATVEFPEGGTGVLIRSPKRVYGVEATLDWQPGENWQLGGIVSWNEGEIDPNDDGEFRPLASFEIQPLKLTAYIKNQTTPGWSNRLQLLVVGERDDAFEEDIDPGPVESYAVLDYISSIQIGKGTLSIGIENLLDNQYFPVFRQLGGARNPDNRLPAPGRTITINYSFTW